MCELHKHILAKLPYEDPFLFVDEIEAISEEKIIGNYTFKEDAFFYKGNFKNNPITPGVILTECMAQIGFVCLGIYLSEKTKKRNQENPDIQFAFSESNCIFYVPVLPNEKVIVISEKIYFRFGKLKCNVIMKNLKNQVVCKAILSGMISSKNTL